MGNPSTRNNVLRLHIQACKHPGFCPSFGPIYVARLLYPWHCLKRPPPSTGTGAVGSTIERRGNQTGTVTFLPPNTACQLSISLTTTSSAAWARSATRP